MKYVPFQKFPASSEGLELVQLMDFRYKARAGRRSDGIGYVAVDAEGCFDVGVDEDQSKLFYRRTAKKITIHWRRAGTTGEAVIFERTEQPELPEKEL